TRRSSDLRLGDLRTLLTRQPQISSPLGRIGRALRADVRGDHHATDVAALVLDVVMLVRLPRTVQIRGDVAHALAPGDLGDHDETSRVHARTASSSRRVAPCTARAIWFKFAPTLASSARSRATSRRSVACPMLCSVSAEMSRSRTHFASDPAPSRRASSASTSCSVWLTDRPILRVRLSAPNAGRPAPRDAAAGTGDEACAWFGSIRNLRPSNARTATARSPRPPRRSKVDCAGHNGAGRNDRYAPLCHAQSYLASLPALRRRRNSARWKQGPGTGTGAAAKEE